MLPRTHHGLPGAAAVAYGAVGVNRNKILRRPSTNVVQPTYIRKDFAQVWLWEQTKEQKFVDRKL